MRKISKMVSFRAYWKIAEWLESFNNGRKTQTIETILAVCMFCLSEEEFRKWRIADARDLKNKKLALVDDDSLVCNTNNQVVCNTEQQLESKG